MTHTVLRSRALGWILAALLLYFGFLVASTPASVLGWALAHATNQHVTLESTSDRFWSGRAGRLNIVDASGKSHRFAQLGWEWLGARLLAGELAFQIRIEDPNLLGSAQIALQPNGARAREVMLDLPASALELFRPGIFPAGLNGDLTLRSPDFRFDRGKFFGNATLTWRTASSALLGNTAGDYAAHIAGVDQHLEFRVETLAGALRIDGEGAWSTMGLSFDGTVRSLAGDQAALSNTLKQFGPELAGGIHRVRFSTMPQAAGG